MKSMETKEHVSREHDLTHCILILFFLVGTGHINEPCILGFVCGCLIGLYALLFCMLYYEQNNTKSELQRKHFVRGWLIFLAIDVGFSACFFILIVLIAILN